MRFKMLSGKWRPFCLSLNVLNKLAYYHACDLLSLCCCTGILVSTNFIRHDPIFNFVNGVILRLNWAMSHFIQSLIFKSFPHDFTFQSKEAKQSRGYDFHCHCLPSFHYVCQMLSSFWLDFICVFWKLTERYMTTKFYPSYNCCSSVAPFINMV